MERKKFHFFSFKLFLGIGDIETSAQLRQIVVSRSIGGFCVVVHLFLFILLATKRSMRGRFVWMLM